MLYIQKKRNYEEQKMQKIQEYYRRKEIRNTEVNKGKRVRQVNLIKGMDGALIGDKTGILVNDILNKVKNKSPEME